MGIPLHREDFVGSRVLAAVGSVATIDMGLAQGVQLATRTWTFRRTAETYELVGRGDVRRLKGQSSTVVAEGTARYREGDIVIIAASDLDLWSLEDPLRRKVSQNIVRRAGSNELDSRDSISDGRVLLNERIVRRFGKTAVVADRLNQLRPNGPAYYEMKRLRLVINERDLTSPPARNLLLDTERILDPISGRPIGFPIVPGPSVETTTTSEASNRLKSERALTGGELGPGLGPYLPMRKFLAGLE